MQITTGGHLSTSFDCKKVYSWSFSRAPCLRQSKGNSMQQVPKAGRMMVLTLSATNYSVGSKSCKLPAALRTHSMFWVSLSWWLSSPGESCFQHPPLLPVAHVALPLPSYVLREGQRSTTCRAPQPGPRGIHLREPSCSMLPFHQSFSAWHRWSQSGLMLPRTDSKQENKQTTRPKANLYQTS